MAKYPLHPQAINLVNTSWKPKLDTTKLAKNVWDSLFDLGDLKAGTATKKIIESFGTDDPIENIAYELVFNALLNASKNLIQEHHEGRFDTIKNLVSKNIKFKGDVTKAIETLEMSIDPSFFSNPKGFDFLPFYKLIFYNWLQDAIGLDELGARYLAKHLPDRFAKELIQEWDNNGERYEKIKTHFTSNPFSENFETENLRAKYYQEIEQYFLKPIFQETKLFLSTTYIQPRFEIHKRNLPKDNVDYLDDNRDLFMSVGFEGKHIHNYINNYFLKNEKAFGLKAEESRLLLLLGQPGQGKTSFCFKVINDVLNALHLNKELVFIRLRDLASPREFLLHPFQELEEHFKNYHFDFDNALIILDGLDELFMVEGLTNNEITEFMVQVGKLITQKPKLHIIITSRFHYTDLKKLGKDKFLIFSLAPLNFEEQKKWIESYHKIYPECKLKEEQLLIINDTNEDRFKEIRELINQPILLYLVVKANFDVSSGGNRSIIYENLFDAMINRTWEKSGQLEKFENFKADDFRNSIGAIALKVYQSKHDFIYKSELIEMDEIKEFMEDNFKADFKNVEDSLSDVLISFYFSSIDDNRLVEGTERRNDYAIEFFHKSLQEYLVAERIWKIFLERFLEKNQREKYIINKWEDALKLTWDLGSAKGLTNEVSQYLREIISNFSDNSMKEELHGRLIKFFLDLCNCNFIYSYDSSNDSNSPFLIAAESFYIYYTVVSSIGRVFFAMRLNRNSHFLNLILIKQVINPDFFNLEGAHLEGAQLEGANLYVADLEGANLKRVKLQGANLEGANLEGANLEGANLDGAYLEGAHLGRAYLEGAHLRGADLEGAEFFRANLKGAYLGGADLEGADLRGANLGGADLRGANLERADLQGANLEGADFGGADLGGADLGGVNLEEVNLQGVNLQEAKLNKSDLRGVRLRGTDLLRAKLQGANLEGAYLNGAYLNGADFEGANLKRVNLQGAYLEGANFEGANLEGANLNGANLNGVEFEGANLEGANLEGAELHGIEQLLKVKSIKASRGIPDKILKQLLIERQDLSI